MSESIPIRLSASLANRAREAASIQDRSLTEQVEHWARLGQVVESALQSSTVRDLKQISHEDRLMAALALADTSAGRKKVSRALAKKHAVRYGASPDDPAKVIRVERRRQGR